MLVRPSVYHIQGRQTGFFGCHWRNTVVWGAPLCLNVALHKTRRWKWKYVVDPEKPSFFFQRKCIQINQFLLHDHYTVLLSCRFCHKCKDEKSFLYYWGQNMFNRCFKRGIFTFFIFNIASLRCKVVFANTVCRLIIAAAAAFTISVPTPEVVLLSIYQRKWQLVQ